MHWWQVVQDRKAVFEQLFMKEVGLGLPANGFSSWRDMVRFVLRHTLHVGDTVNLFFVFAVFLENREGEGVVL